LSLQASSFESFKDQEKLLAEREQRGELKGKLEATQGTLIDIANDLHGPCPIPCRQRSSRSDPSRPYE
jgi:hypothetical protein